MSTEPKPRPPAETHKRQSAYLVGAAIVIAAITVGLVLMDRGGTSRDENQGRSNESHSQEPPRQPESR